MRTFFATLWDRIVTEPAAVTAALTGVLPLLVLLNQSWLNADQVAVIGSAVAAVLAFVVAVATKHGTLPIAIGVVTAFTAVGAAYGLNLTPAQTAIILGAVGTVGHLLNWSGTSPKFGSLAPAAVVPVAVVQAAAAPAEPVLTPAQKGAITRARKKAQAAQAGLD